jgi:hypothetical protein
MSAMRTRRVVPTILIASALCAWCGWVSGYHHSTTPAIATWSASLAIVVVIDVLFWCGRHDRRPALRVPPATDPWPRSGQGGGGRALLGISPWLALVLVVLAWEVLGIDTGAHEAHLTISALAQAFRPLKAGLLLVWMTVGLGYGAARTRAPLEGPSREKAHGEPPGASSCAGVAVMFGQRAVFAHEAFPPALLLPNSRAAGVAFWVGFVVACVLVDLAARRSRGRLANAEEFVRLISGPAVANILLAVAWAYAGWHLFAH